MAACCAVLVAPQAAITFNSASFPTCYGKTFTDRLFGLRKRAATEQHEFDLLCAEPGIEHCLAPPMRPQTNGMVERFNGRIEDVLQSHRFHSGKDLEQTSCATSTSTTANSRKRHSRAERPSPPSRTGNAKGRSCSGSGSIITRDVTLRQEVA